MKVEMVSTVSTAAVSSFSLLHRWGIRIFWNKLILYQESAKVREHDEIFAMAVGAQRERIAARGPLSKTSYFYKLSELLVQRMVV